MENPKVEPTPSIVRHMLRKDAPASQVNNLAATLPQSASIFAEQNNTNVGNATINTTQSMSLSVSPGMKYTPYSKNSAAHTEYHATKSTPPLQDSRLRHTSASSGRSQEYATTHQNHVESDAYSTFLGNPLYSTLPTVPPPPISASILLPIPPPTLLPPSQ
eukprot:Phypoly_transcript_14497.p1 GENE.Phypoly_transcript_14497~~Phypoly_transcript_14497.p1  ORF type:complete len:161 (+),score=29.24 Phypoly_transcript_14497:499-981(+)